MASQAHREEGWAKPTNGKRAEPRALGNAAHFLVHLASPNKTIKKSSRWSKLRELLFIIVLLGLNPVRLQKQGTVQRKNRNRCMYQHQ